MLIEHLYTGHMNRLQNSLAPALATAGMLHFVRPKPFDGIVPPQLPGSQRFYTCASGVAELTTAALLAAPRTRKVGGLSAAVLPDCGLAGEHVHGVAVAAQTVVPPVHHHRPDPAAGSYDPRGVGHLQGPQGLGMMVSANQVRQGVVDKLAVRAPESSICPWEVARELGGDTWRELMTFVRETAAQMAREGTIVATQGDAVVDAEGSKGPIRLRRGPGW